jgi:hypothetical protein
MRPLNAINDLDATPDRVWGILTATQAYDKRYQARCGSVDEDASFVGGVETRRTGPMPS